MEGSKDRAGIGLTIFVTFIAFGVSNVFGTIVSSESGTMEGVVVPFQNGNVHQFRKIPYAKPPVGPLRFRKPVKTPPWNDTLDARNYGPSCIQSGELTFPISEDCLFLNVYVPNEVSATANKSVMVWIHGGGYIGGTAISYDGSTLALHGDVIVVTLNYRLGIFGFFSTGDSNARGNYGLWDQIEALKWIKSNIIYFGGNPDSITLFGESAGAEIISHLAVIPQNRGLFHRVIMQSGSLGRFLSMDNKGQIANARAFGDHLNCSDNRNTSFLVSCLRGVNTTILQMGSNVIYPFSSLDALFLSGLYPTIDEDLIPSDPVKLLKNQSSEQFAFFQSLDVISGSTSAEGSVFLLVLQMFPSLSLPSVDFYEGIPNWVLQLFARQLTELYYGNDTRVIQAISDMYTSPDIDEQSRLFIDLISDAFYHTPMLESLLLHDGGYSNTFQYYFSNQPEFDPVIGVLPDWFVGAGHAAELELLFGNMEYLKAEERLLSAKMMSYWTNFAKNGNERTGIGLTILFIFTSFCISNVLGTIVSSESGTMEGVVVPSQNGNVHQFRKIPYAKPPVGPLRFSKPVKRPPWNDTLDARNYGPGCIQSGELTFPISEDCLFLNVYVPNEVSATANKSVMVWIHGGGYIGGTAISYDGSTLALHGDVIVVTLNYRLGIFGFFSTGDSNARGNYGLWDQIEALKWIKSNILYFGGNPDSITLFGESAGAEIISHLAVIPQNRELFHRVIMQSGSLGRFLSMDNKGQIANARAFGDYLNCSDIRNTSFLVSCLRGVNTTILQMGSNVIYPFSSLDALFLSGLYPTIDDDLIPSDPVKLLKNQSSEQFAFFQSLDVISGSTSAEGSVFLLVLQMFPSLSLPSVDFYEGIPNWVLQLFARQLTELYYGNDTRVIQAISDMYTSPDIDEQSRLFIDLISDAFYHTPMLESLLLHDGGYSNTFQYYFSNQPEFDPVIGVLPDWFVGAGHAAELELLFVSATANKSVMVWIHGGGYISGTAISYDGSTLALHGDVIVVTLNYRLGIFGFFSTGDSNARGNYGLWDQIEALKWIKSNILYFGGNPDSITLFGESAGAEIISHLAVIPQNRGLFHRVIMQSGSLGRFLSMNNKGQIANARAFGDYLNCSDIRNTSFLVSCLRGVNTTILQMGSNVIYPFSSLDALFLSGLYPTIDDDLIPSDPVKLLKNQSSEQFAFFQSLDVISGSTSAEGSVFLLVLQMFPSLSLPSVDFYEGIPNWVLQLFARQLTELYYGNDTRVIQAISDMYTSPDIDEQSRLFIDLISDAFYHTPMLESLLLHDGGYSNTFQYYFSNQPEFDPVIGVLPDWFVGAGHAAELELLFGNMEYLKAEERLLSAKMMSYWTNFAKNGNERTGIGLTILFIFTSFCISNVLGTIVSSESGTMEGVVVPSQNGNVHQFRKIPYAKPPVGPLRFSKPVKRPPWNDTLDARNYGPGCIQSGELTFPISEDCLFLNVYVPNEVSATANKSVMVWIHGGGYSTGTARSYDGSTLALHGDVIVVTVNYRLGIFGFFSTGDSNARGNYGLWDQIEALKWIKSNIIYFGGNPDSVTLFGESAGAFSVSHLAMIPANKGLFHRVIMQSGSLSSFGSVTKDPSKSAIGLGKYLNCNNVENSESLVACLRGLYASLLHQSAETVYVYSSIGKNFGLTLPFAPVIDGELIPSDPISLLQNESSEQFKFYQSLDVISGCNSAEGSLFVVFISAFPTVSLPAVDMTEGIPTSVLKLFVKPLIEYYYNNDTRILQNINDKYTTSDIAKQGRLFVNLFGDTHFYTPMFESLLAHDKGGNSKANTFQYYFSKSSQVDILMGQPPKWFEGAGHAAEIVYVFSNKYLQGDDADLSTKMMSYWINFANNGNPNTGLPVPYWPEFDETFRQYINLDTNITTGSELLGERMRFWTEEIPRINSEREITISTLLGQVKGIQHQVKGQNISQFRRIPFAEPPIGPLRFAKPKPITEWNGILDATRFGPSCIQTRYPRSEYSYPNKNISEDCLFLNIYAPNDVTLEANKSVMVWIHGGGFTSGAGMTYDGTPLALQGDVIVVTLNYRLGILGFLSTGDSNARGNYGLWDQIEALKWIKSNIRYFGGNPDSITLFGESAGAESISHLAIIPQNRGLFHRVIMQSGSLGRFESMDNKGQIAKARAFGDHLNCSENQNTPLLVSCLRTVNATVLQTGSDLIYSYSSLDAMFVSGLYPAIDDDLIPSDPMKLLKNQSSEQFAFFQSLDVISGSTSAEGSLFLSVLQMFPSLSLPSVDFYEGIPNWVLQLFARQLTELYYGNDTRVIQAISDMYTSPDIEEQSRLFIDLMSDAIFHTPILESLLLHDEGYTNSNTFQYYFSNQPEFDPVIGVVPDWFVGAGHAAELELLFVNTEYLKAKDRLLSAKMMSYWTNFAKNGNPNTGRSVPYWPEFDETFRQYINLDTNITTGSELLGERMRFWTEEIPRIISEREITISTLLGQVKGIQHQVKGQNISQFRRIPFAEPPIGPLRFAKPKPITKWNGILDATRFGPSCMQTRFPGSDNNYPNKNISEDCLFLNIYVPNDATLEANKSVMVWIHGGGFTSGAGMTYDGTPLALQGDVIVVTLNYRLGILGFLSTGDSNARGNYGLWDQIEALKWIKSNIRYFGGNPDSITLFGESAGALSVSIHAIIPQNRGLFHRVIIQSGSLGRLGSLGNDQLTKAHTLGDQFNCSQSQNTSSLISCLRGIDATALEMKSNIIYSLSSADDIFRISLSPVVDGDLIPGDPGQLLRNQSSEQFAFFQSLDVISGCTSAEGTVFLLTVQLFPILSLPPVNLYQGIPNWVMQLFANGLTEVFYDNDNRVLEAIIKQYSSLDIEEQSRLVVNLLSDAFYYIPMLETLQLHDKGGNTNSNTFQYYFSNQPEIDPFLGPLPKWFEGAGHFAEIKYLFDNWGYLKGEDRLLSAKMTSYWSNFANHGNPNTGLPVPYWPEFDETFRQYINLDTNITTGSELLGERMRFWTEEIPRIISEREITISTLLGQVKGIQHQLKGQNISQFRRIPFAEPPIGPLRFAKPKPITEWNGILDATRFGPSCMQTRFPGSANNYPNKDISEDCLFLNIYVPNDVTLEANKSVMVWIHGGGFKYGAAMTYDGTPLALQGDVIVVTLNYRLGILGFLSTGDSNSRGNYGLWDQIEALKWIKSNIKYFGGNPDSITLFGESAGALSVSIHAIIPQNRGLFHRVIIQSGSLGRLGSLGNDQLTKAHTLGDQFNCSQSQNTSLLISCLRGIDATALEMKSNIIYSLSSADDIFRISLSPVVDGDLISGDPGQLLSNQSSEQFAFFQSLDVISGCTSAEGTVFLRNVQLFPILSLPPVNLYQGIPNWVMKLFANSLTEIFYGNDIRVLEAVIKQYSSLDIEEQSRLVVNLLSDAFYYIPMLETLQLHDKGGNTNSNTFQYYFSNQPEIDPFLGPLPKWFEGAGHFAEIKYLFDNWGYLKGEDRLLSAKMTSYWSNFANHGNPNIGLPVPYWPEFDDTRRQYINLDTNITSGSYLLGDRLQFWTDEIPRILAEKYIVVSTPMGPIKGLVENVKNTNISQFRRIPFAEPPIGPLRFKKPVPISKWTDTLDATRFGPSCIQTVYPGMEMFLPNTDISEDCLFLNIYVPNEVTVTANKSVMVWIHGGGYQSGTGMMYSGTPLALHGDVIVVTLNYRLGVIGFLSTSDSSARGNYGLWDQIEALKWIKTNIKYFGGNPDSITIFGESAGAFSISHLAMIPENKGLFHRVIMQSGSLNSFGGITKDPLMYTKALGSQLQCDDIDNTTSLVSCLREMEYSDLQSTGDIIYSAFPSISSAYQFSISPVIDGELIPSHPVALFQNASSEQFAFFQSLDVISGCNSAEGNLAMSAFYFFPYLNLPAVNISAGIPSWVLKLFAQGLTELKYDNDTRILQHIYDKYTSTDIGEQGRLFVDFFGDLEFYIPMLETLLVHDRGENMKTNAFQYLFSKEPLVDIANGELPSWFKGAAHGAEAMFLFDDIDLLKGDDKFISTQMMSYWSNFAKHGNPNTGLPVPYWPEFDETFRQYINLDTNITTGSELLGERMRFWTEEIPRIISEREITISTLLGQVKGIQHQVKGQNISQFRRIPFAEPPIGPLRFAKPKRITEWNGILEATRFGPSCMQTRFPGSANNYPNKDISEDCLFLNIYVPNDVTLEANKSVMVWIHGGGFKYGAAMTYDGTPLALQGDVIVVTLNYRLGILGFLSTGDSNSRGNYGLWDQIEALKWIKSNIKYFGGNPDSITLFGESAGALSVSIHAIIPQNRGLFHRVIIQSGSLGRLGSLGNDQLTKAHTLGDQFNCSQSQNTSLLISCLRGIDATALEMKSNIIYSLSSADDIFRISLSPVVDGDLISGDPGQLLSNQSSEQFAFFQSLDVISGCTSAEATVFLRNVQLFPILSLPPVNLYQGIPNWVMKLFANSLTEIFYGNDIRVLEAVIKQYSSLDIEEQSRLVVNLLSDAFYYIPMLETLQLHDKGGNTNSNTFQYYFSNQPEIDPFLGPLPKWFEGAGHFAEIKYLFDNWGYLKGEDRLLSAKMTSYWSNFANHGNPNIGLPVPYWPEFDDTTRQYINLDTNITSGSYLLGDRLQFWTDEIPRILAEKYIVVSTPIGPIKGLVENVKNTNISQFRRIPFAEPPIGPLRFKKPVPISKWTDTLDATRFGPSCIQTVYPGMEMFLPNTDISEDCLFLNIYVPNEVTVTANKSVMVWIHGGGYQSGTGMMYSGTPLALHGDVIVVTLNYRLGVIGFLSTSDSSARGNYGLWDQIEALKWIKTNIKYFGGNPDSITIFGESAGAFSISHLAMIPENKGLFHRVIMQSGSLNSFGGITKDPLMYTKALGSQLQCDDIDNTTSLVSCLREMEYSDLQSTGDIIYSAFPSISSAYQFSISPVIDGELIPSHPVALFQNASSEQFAFFQSLDVISGCNSAEGNLAMSAFYFFPYLNLPAVNISAGIPSWVLKLFAQGLTELKYDNDTRILQHIYEKYTSTDIGEQARLFVDFFGDLEFYIPMLETLLVHDRGGNMKANAFQYLFSKEPLVDIANGELPSWFKGAAHGAEAMFLFDDIDLLKGDDKFISTQMMSYWSNFAKHGNPNTGLPVSYWPKFDETKRKYLDLNANITTRFDLFGDRMQFWTEKIPRLLSENEIIINTGIGQIKGIQQLVEGKYISQFRGIPFAEPPIGSMRFAKPVSISKWSGTLDASRFGSACIQSTAPGWDINLPNKNISEDCLFLNIYVPNEVKMTANKSVMVWIHGGGYESGAGMAYDGTSLALHGDVIVVTLNYRLGVLGFFSTADSSARGNYGLWDQIEALKWIKTNIKYFGGNPDSITIFGESAGAFSISHLAIIPENKGLFHRVIMQSGSLSSFGAITKDPLMYAQQLGSQLQCDDINNTTSLVFCLRGLESASLQAGAEVVYSGFSSVASNFEYALSPVIDGDLIPSHPLALLQDQSSEQFEFFQSLDIISGCNSAEGSVFVMLVQYFPYFSLPAVNVSEGIPIWVLELFAEGLTEVYYNNDTRILKPIYDQYTSTDVTEQGRLLVHLLGDIIFYMPMLESLLIHDRGGNTNGNSFQYFFTNQPDIDPVIGVLPEWFEGAGHFAEINYLFDNWGYLNIDDRFLSNQMMSYWTNFANYGNPNIGLPVTYWPEFNATTRQFINLDTNITTGSELLGDRMRFWSERIPRIIAPNPTTTPIPLNDISYAQEQCASFVVIWTCILVSATMILL
ncbi:uncharacterized protein LOC117341889 [Pecten maximus]|uniref:uncharacterized protein LOC117341889 n=1 Tax=Pecten maximus TaxID=6579 RepID=UPI00145820B1|nr:uncharacterized protein LOC117341889 [Pecten maximus]